jgi:hypothetical protein
MSSATDRLQCDPAALDALIRPPFFEEVRTVADRSPALVAIPSRPDRFDPTTVAAELIRSRTSRRFCGFVMKGGLVVKRESAIP